MLSFVELHYSLLLNYIISISKTQDMVETPAEGRVQVEVGGGEQKPNQSVKVLLVCYYWGIELTVFNGFIKKNKNIRLYVRY